MQFGRSLALGIAFAVLLPGVWTSTPPRVADEAASPLPPPIRAPDSYVPLGFVENRGQLTNDEVRFYANAGGTQIGLAAGKVLFTVGGNEGPGALVEAMFVGANPSVPEGRSPLPVRTHYFRGADPAEWHAGVPSVSEVEFADLYEGIDLLYRVTEEGVKYEFRVAAGADPSRIQVGYAGADGLAVDAAGELTVRTAAGILRDSAPVGYQGDVVVPCRFVLRSETVVGYECPTRDVEEPLVVDPLVYATFLGGSFLDFGDAIAIDAAGNAYVTGRANSTDFPTTPGAFDTTHTGGFTDAFVAKVGPTGSTLVWATFLGGAGRADTGLAIAVDGTGGVYVAGQTDSPDFPVTIGSLDTSFSGSSDGFLVRLRSGGDALAFGTYVGGSGGDIISSLVLDAAGNAYFTGITQSFDFPTTPGAYDSTYAGGFFDGFLAGLDSAGASLLLSTFLGGSLLNGGNAIDRDVDGNLYVAGSTNSPDFPATPGAYDTTLGGLGDGFLSKFNPTGTALLNATFLGGSSGNEGAFSVVVDAAGSAYVSGNTDAADFPTTPGAFDWTYGGSTDTFLVKLDPAFANLEYGTYIGGSGDDSEATIRVNPAGQVYMAGQTSSPDFPVTPGAIYTTYRGGQYDAYALRLNATGTGLVYSTFLGGSLTDQGWGLAIDASSAYVVGSTNSTDFPATGGSYDTTLNGGYDAFLAKVTLAHPISIDAAPSGLQVEVDGVPRTTPYVFDCEPGTTHLLNAPSPQSPSNTRYAFFSWSDMGTQSHTITCTAPEAYVAMFVATDFLATIHTSPEGLIVDLDGTFRATPYAFWCPAGSTHTVTALNPQGGPPTRYVFLSWSDGGAQSHTFTCSSPRDLTAFYETQHQVVVDTSPANRQLLVDGFLEVAPQTYWWAEGSAHTLEAPSPQVVGPTRYLFVSWSDGGARQHAVTADAPATYTATFRTESQVTIDTAPGALDVIVNGTRVTAPYTFWCTPGDSVALDVPTPQGVTQVRFAFDSWSDGGAKAHSVLCGAALSYTAAFRTEYETRVATAPPGLQVDVNGTTYPAPYTFWCSEGTSYGLGVASPQTVGSTRYVFAGWSDGGARNHAVGCTQSISYTAVFTAEYEVTIATSPAGLEVIVDGSPMAGPVSFWWPAGSPHTLDVATPQGGPYTRFAFSAWSDGGPRNHTVTATAPVTITASFATEHRVVIDSVPPGREVRVDGATTVLPLTIWWRDGDAHTLAIVTPQSVSSVERYVWDAWSDGGPRDRAVPVTGPLNLTATFRHQYKLTIQSPYGSPFCNLPDCWYDEDTDAILNVGNATVSGGTVRFRFRAWTGDVTSPGLLTIVLMDRPKTAIATWTTEYLLTVVSVYGNATGGDWYPADTTAEFAVASADVAVGGKRYRFIGWTGDVNSTALGGTILMDGPKTVVANWEEVQFAESLVVWLLPIAVLIGLVLFFLWFRRRKREAEPSEDAAKADAETPPPKEDAGPSPDLEDEVDLDARPER